MTIRYAAFSHSNTTWCAHTRYCRRLRGEGTADRRPRGAGFAILQSGYEYEHLLRWMLVCRVIEAIEAACACLSQRLHGLLLHRADNLVSAAGPAIWAAMSGKAAVRRA